MLAQNEKSTEEAEQIRRIFDDCGEWLLSDNFALQNREIEIYAQNGKLFLSCLTARGLRTRRVLSWEHSGEKLIFTVAANLNSSKTRLEFVPRIAAAALREDLNNARFARAIEIAELARREFSGRSKIETIKLNQSNRRGQFGTVARILLVNAAGKTFAVCGSISDKSEAENLLSASLLWLAKLEEKRRVAELWLIAEKNAAEELQKLCALLREPLREKIKIYARIASQNLNAENEQTDCKEKEILISVEVVKPFVLLTEKTRKIKLRDKVYRSETAQRIVELEPDKIDVVQSKKGETLRFNGLPFARVRRILGEERAWFGLERKRQILCDESFADFENLLAQLNENRRADAGDNKRSFIYRAAPEAWLESILRRDVSRLDPNLILAPLHAQFRLNGKTGALDLLALRTDGRLAVVELKVAPDREHIFQAVGYWLQIERQRRAGNIERAALFGNLKIADCAPLVYLVAPLLSFHKDFDVLARQISDEIEIWRFDLNEDWRSEVRVTRRRRVD